jgi:predicted RNase H-like nuclease
MTAGTDKPVQNTLSLKRSHAVGFDGCPAGWIAAEIDAHGRTEFHLCCDAREIWNRFSKAESLLIDIPIGLNEENSGWRDCDLLARELLRFPRCCSVFAPPVRPVLVAKSYAEACTISQGRTGKKISKQCWGILPKIREVDEFLMSVPEAVGRLRECHPEVVFYGLNRAKAMKHKKSTAAGLEERLSVIESFHPSARQDIKKARAAFLRRQVHTDDLVDALAAAVIGHIGSFRLRTLPQLPLKDLYGIPREIVFL